MYWNFADDSFVQNIWADAPIDDPAYEMLMNSANVLVASYAPPLAEGATIPDNYKHAEIICASDLWSRMRGGNDQQIGTDDLVIPAAPLLYLWRDLVRPKASPLSRLR